MNKEIKAAPTAGPTINVEIRGLRELDNGVFALQGVAPLEINPLPIADLLQDAGIPAEIAERYADEFLARVFREEIARVLASRMRRVA